MLGDDKVDYTTEQKECIKAHDDYKDDGIYLGKSYNYDI